MLVPIIKHVDFINIVFNNIIMKNNWEYINFSLNIKGRPHRTNCIHFCDIENTRKSKRTQESVITVLKPYPATTLARLTHNQVRSLRWLFKAAESPSSTLPSSPSASLSLRPTTLVHRRHFRAGAPLPPMVCG